MSLRCVRSPDAPKMTSENGSSAYGMAAELVAKRGEQPVREGVVAPRAEAREERRGDGRRRHRLLDGILDGPAALARILDVGLEAFELGVGGQSGRRQLEQPRADHRAPIPERGDLPQVHPGLRPGPELEAFGV